MGFCRRRPASRTSEVHTSAAPSLGETALLLAWRSSSLLLSSTACQWSRQRRPGLDRRRAQSSWCRRPSPPRRSLTLKPPAPRRSRSMSASKRSTPSSVPPFPFRAYDPAQPNAPPRDAEAESQVHCGTLVTCQLCGALARLPVLARAVVPAEGGLLSGSALVRVSSGERNGRRGAVPSTGNSRWHQLTPQWSSAGPFPQTW